MLTAQHLCIMCEHYKQVPSLCVNHKVRRRAKLKTMAHLKIPRLCKRPGEGGVRGDVREDCGAWLQTTCGSTEVVSWMGVLSEAEVDFCPITCLTDKTKDLNFWPQCLCVITMKRFQYLILIFVKKCILGSEGGGSGPTSF